MRNVGLFAGIGGMELGLESQEHSTALLCEIDPGAQAVLKARFPRVPLVADVRDVERLEGNVDLIAAGFPCQDLSQAGETRGIGGEKSGIVQHLFRILRVNEVPSVLIENVPFMLQLGNGRAIHFLTSSLEELGYHWAYRVVDAHCFGLPQRRERVYLLASRKWMPWNTLFKEEREARRPVFESGLACGFYWTEGTRGLGWAVDAIPTLKGGSTIGIPSPPGVWLPGDRVVRPTITAGERLQGFPRGWTEPAESVRRKGMRWKLVGNAVSVRASAWIGRLLREVTHDEPLDLTTRISLLDSKRWPGAAFGGPGLTPRAVRISKWPRDDARVPLSEFLGDEVEDLSLRAVSGFVSRLESGRLRYPREFLEALVEHRSRMAEKAPA